MKKITYSTLLILMILTLTTCDKNECQNCYPTVFECKVDGKTWKTSCESKDFFGCTALDVQYYQKINALDIYAFNKNEGSIFLFVRDTPLKIGNNKFWKLTSVGSNKNASNICGRFNLDTIKMGNLNLTTIDTISQILKGTFSFIAVDSCKNIINISEGKLDVIYRN